MPETNATLAQAIYDRKAAAVTMHWHLSRAAQMVATGLNLGHDFEVEMISAEVARKAWYEAQDAILRAEPPHGSSAEPDHGG